MSFRYAGEVSVADEVLVQVDELTPAKVISVSTFTLQGDCNTITCIFFVSHIISYLLTVIH